MKPTSFVIDTTKQLEKIYRSAFNVYKEQIEQLVKEYTNAEVFIHAIAEEQPHRWRIIFTPGSDVKYIEYWRVNDNVANLQITLVDKSPRLSPGKLIQLHTVNLTDYPDLRHCTHVMRQSDTLHAALLSGFCGAGNMDTLRPMDKVFLHRKKPEGIQYHSEANI